MFEFLHNAMHPFDLDGLLGLLPSLWPAVVEWVKAKVA